MHLLGTGKAIAATSRPFEQILGCFIDTTSTFNSNHIPLNYGGLGIPEYCTTPPYSGRGGRTRYDLMHTFAIRGKGKGASERSFDFFLERLSSSAAAAASIPSPQTLCSYEDFFGLG